MRRAGLRVELDDSNERLSAKIRQAQLQKVPYMLVVGKKEVANGTVALRLRSEEDLGVMAMDDFIKLARAVIAEKRL